MKVQVIDVDYVMVNSKPLIRIFGKTENNKSVCVFYDKFLPYFYIYGKDYEKITKVLKSKFNEINTEIVKRKTPIGYDDDKEVLKVIGRDPSKVPEMREFAYKIPGVIDVFEADILFKYRFMVDMGIRGMGWIDVKGKPIQTTTVKVNAIEADEIKPIDKIENVELKYLSVDIECISSDNKLPEPKKDPIIMISLAFMPKYMNKEQIILLAKPVKKDGNIIGCSNEKEMLEKFKEIVNRYDPDIMIAYNGNNFDFPYIVKRMEVLGIRPDIGRSEKNAYTRSFGNISITSVNGRVLVDPYEIIKNDPYIKFKRYNLATVAKEMLSMEKLDVGGARGINKLWEGNRNDVLELVEYAKRDSILALKLVTEKSLIDKFFEISKISGLLLQDVFGGQSQRVENMLLMKFKEKGFLMPSKPDQHVLGKRIKERNEYGLKGAIVLEPKIGFYTTGSIIVLDFTSLYPSLIRAYNICPTTLIKKKEHENLDHIKSPFGSMFVKPNIRKGILPELAEELITSRAKIKKEMKSEKDPERKRILNAKQLAFKILANSIYGYTGYLRARLYVIDVANSITSFGRENIMKTRKLVEENFPVKIIYGDTDSIFIKTDISDLEMAKDYGMKIAKFVTSNLDGLDLKFEKIFKTFLIIAKKRYAGWAFEPEGNGWKDKIDMKGIETVRRDWCSLTSETMMKVLEILLKEKDKEKAKAHVRKVLNDLSKNKIPIEKLTIVKGITKSLDKYDGVQPHVEVAKKILKRDPTRGSVVGDRIEFVIVKGNAMLSKRAEDPEYVKKNNIEIDPQYYMENQLLPPLERIFEVCGISKTELLEGSKQKNLFELLNRKKSPDETILDNFDSVTCKKCGWSFRRPPLSGVCPKCGGKLYFQFNGSIGKMVRIKTIL